MTSYEKFTALCKLRGDFSVGSSPTTGTNM